jgi:hypothetical protein
VPGPGFSLQQSKNGRKKGRKEEEKLKQTNKQNHVLLRREDRVK